MARKTIEKNIALDDVRKKYYVTFNFGVVDGVEVKPVKTFNTLKEARQALKEHEANKVKGTLLIPKDITTSEWLDYYYTNIVMVSNAETTQYSDNNLIKHIKPELGNIKLQELKPVDIQNYYTGKIKSGLAPNTVRKHHDFLHKCLKLAVRQGIILNNPSDNTDPPKVKRPQITPYNKEQTKKLLESVKQYSEDNINIELIVNLAVFCGLRRGEIMGLKWNCVDFENRTIAIKITRTTAGKNIEKGPKEEESYRTLAMPDTIFELLQKEYNEQQENKKRYKHYQDTDLVIVQDNGTPIAPNSVSSKISIVVEQNNLPDITLHGLRHTFATLGKDAGIPTYDISKLLGHSNVATTNDIYTHAFKDIQKKNMKKVENKIKK